MKQMCLRLTLLASFVAAGPAVAMDIWGTGEVPSIADAKDVPRSLEAIWSGYEAHFDTHNPLEPVTHKSWEVDEIVVNWTQVSVGVFRGEKAAICGYWAYPKGAKNLPAILAFTGGGQGAIEGIAVEWAKLGYACFHPHNAQGRPRGLADGLPSTDWGVIAHKGGYGPYGSLVAQASTIDDVLSPRNSFYFSRQISSRRIISFLCKQAQVNADAIGVTGHSTGGALATQVSIDPRIAAAVPSMGGAGGLWKTHPHLTGNVRNQGNLTGDDLELLENTIDGYAYYKKMHAPILLVGASNDFNAPDWNCTESLKLATVDKRFSSAANLSHRTAPEVAMAAYQWFEAQLKGKLTFPKTANAEFLLKQADGGPILRLKVPSATLRIKRVELYVANDGDVKTRKWYPVTAERIADGIWQGKAPVADKTKPLCAFANVIYDVGPVDVPVSRYNGKSEMCVTSTYAYAWPEELQAAKQPPVRPAEGATFSTSTMTLTVAPDASVSLKRIDRGKVVSTSKSMGWSIVKWTDRSKTNRVGTRYALDNMARIGLNELLLWSSDEPFKVKVAIVPKERYFTFQLLQVSNDLNTGGLNNEWPGHRVEFDIRTDSQNDGWTLKTMLLNPYSELNTRNPHKTENGAAFRWPYPQWSQTDDRPQPQGLVAVFGFISDDEHDDILTDIWAAEETLPRPNRAKLTSWTRADVTAWLDRWETEMAKPWREFSFSAQGEYENLFRIADVAQAGGLNRIYLHNFEWQGNSPETPNEKLFPNGASDVVKWRDYCDARGIDLRLHGFGPMIQADDPKYGRLAQPDGLARSARGTLLKDVTKDERTLLVKPDLSLWPGLKPGMLPHYQFPPWGTSNGGLGNAFPPYYESNGSCVRINGQLYSYTAKLSPDDLWQVTLTRPLPGLAFVDHSAGDLVEFIVMGSGGWFTPDSRSAMHEQMAKEYAANLNDFAANPHYDGAGWTGDIGSWGMRKYAQMVYEQLDHPTITDSAFGIIPFGHLEYQFKRIEALTEGSGRPGTMSMVTRNDAIHASSMDDAIHGLNKGVWQTNASIRGNHRGITMEDIDTLGIWDEAMKAFFLWSEMKPHMSDEQKALIAARKRGRASGMKHDVFVASETDEGWQITRTRAMRREGIDAPWQHIPERPDASPRQYLKAAGKALKDLDNPYVSQAPVVELHVMANMAAENQENIPLMPQEAGDLINPPGADQSLGYRNGRLTISHDNSKAPEDYRYYARKDVVGHWTYASIADSAVLDMGSARGVAITVRGDNSGAVLAFTTGSGFPRTYLVDIDFVGERSIEIPCGEAVNNRADWDTGRGAVITAFRYNKVDRFRVYLNKVPAKTNTSVEILDIRAMKEDRVTGLVDPVLELNGVKASVSGTIPYDHYLLYPGGSSAKVYGPNWKFVKELPVEGPGFKANKGSNTFSVTAPKSPHAWLSSRIKVKDRENAIRIDKTQKGAL